MEQERELEREQEQEQEQERELELGLEREQERERELEQEQELERERELERELELEREQERERELELELEQEPMKSHHNTTNESGQLLLDFQKKAQSQELDILRFFELNNKPYTPSEVHECLFDSSTPITSVRRAMTNLAKRGILYKTELKAPGPYKRPEYYWRKK